MKFSTSLVRGLVWLVTACGVAYAGTAAYQASTRQGAAMVADPGRPAAAGANAVGRSQAADEADAAAAAARAVIATASQPTTAPDSTSDRVGAIAGSFRVDESGAATYSIPLFTPPGTAGVVPQVALAYSSQGGDGPLGRGWSISGLSSITRCRATREAGDFIVSGKPVDGNPRPVDFGSTDRFCLDGKRLIPAPSGTAPCKALPGALQVTQWRGEVDVQERICGYAFDGKGPRFFTVERKDGSTSWFGDRRETQGGLNDGDSRDAAFSTPKGILVWSLARFQDSTGNFIDYTYRTNPTQGHPGEQHIASIAWTGKNVLPGQSGDPQKPDQRIDFHYQTMPAAEFSRSLAASYVVWQTQYLRDVTVSAQGHAVRYYRTDYQFTLASPHTRVMSQLEECLDDTASVCLSPTTFGITPGQTAFSDASSPAGLSFAGLSSYKLADVDGDGRQDIVWIGNVDDADCKYSKVFVSYSQLDDSGKQTFVTNPTDICVPFDKDSIPDTWKLFDYDGDGREDLMVPTSANTWAIYHSNGRPAANGQIFDTSRNLIDGIGIPTFTDSQQIPDFADINGDGLMDVIYAANGTMHARISQRQADGSWAWGQERALEVPDNAPSPCSSLPGQVWCYYSIDTTESQHYHLNDFNGDGRADILMRVTLSTCPPGGGGGTGGGSGNGGGKAFLQTAATQSGDCDSGQYLQVMTIQSVAAGATGAVTVYPTGAWQMSDTNHHSVNWNVKFADVNGDGLTDALVQTQDVHVDGDNNNGGVWQLELNDGTGHFVTVQSDITISRYSQYLQWTDVNGDGRADLVYPNAASKCAFQVQYARPDGLLDDPVALPGALACGDDDLTTKPWAQIFADFDGDGSVDYLLASLDGKGVTAWRASAGARYSPHGAIQSITNGYGAATFIDYAPLTNAAVYRPDAGSRNTLRYGRGSPVVDLLAPMYVVAYVDSSAPIFADAAHLSAVFYRYAGAKMQAGGRGFLGFRQITTFDDNHDQQYVATTTDYRQDFPFIGTPATTTRTVVNTAYAPTGCLTDIDSASGNACFLAPGHPFAPVQGVQISSSTHAWASWPAFSAGVQTPLHVRSAGTEDILRDPASGKITSDVGTAFAGYDAFDDVGDTVVDTYSDNGKTLVSEVRTHDTYANDEAGWRLGRLATSTVTHTRSGQSIVRKTRFTYDMDSAAETGLLTSEEIQPGGSADQDRCTVYTLDAYGNRTAATTCSADIADCGRRWRTFTRSPATAAHRPRSSATRAPPTTATGGTRWPATSRSGTAAARWKCRRR